MTDVITSRLDCFLQIEGLGDFTLARFSANFGVNEMPQAECSLAVGRQASANMQPAEIHTKLGRLTSMLRCKVWFNGEGQYDRSRNWPSGYRLLFDGYLTGLGYRTNSQGQVQYVAQLVHWLSDLAFSSTLSEQSHPRNANDFTYRAVFQPMLAHQAGGAGPQSGPEALSQLRASSTNFTVDKIQQDFWGAALKSFFVALSQENHLNLTGELVDLFNLNGKNDAALAALARMEGVGQTEQDLKLSSYNVPLALKLSADGGLAALIAFSIAEYIGRSSAESLAHQTIWDLLVGALAPAFMFGVVPLVEKALVVPRTPALRSNWRTLSSNDFNHVDFSAGIPRPIRALAIMTGQQSETSGDGTVGNPFAIVGVGGYYAPPEVANGKGMLRIIGPPPWLHNIPSSGLSAARTTGIRGQRPIATATTPKSARDEQLVGARFGPRPGAAILGSAELFNRYARAMYVADHLRSRTGQLVGKLRFDISPLSTILVEGRSEQFLGDKDQLGQTLAAEVIRVSIGIDAEAPAAGMSLQLMNIRSEKENRGDSTSLEEHPLYGTVFKGAPLVDGLSF